MADETTSKSHKFYVYLRIFSTPSCVKWHIMWIFIVQQNSACSILSGGGTERIDQALILMKIFLASLKARYYDFTWVGYCDFHSHSGSSKAFSLSTAAARGFLASTPLEGGVVRLVAPLWCSITFPLLPF